MRNPFRSEQEAYRLLLLTIGYFALIVTAATIGGVWVGTGVFVVLTALGMWWYTRQGEEVEPAPHVRRGAENERRILVIANETAGGAELRDVLRRRAEGVRQRVLVVCPALNSRLRHWATDDAAAQAAAQERLDRSLESLARVGVEARGEVGDADPLQAIEDAVRSFGPDEIVISTHPPGRSQWLEKRIVERAQARFSEPVTHVVVDLEAASDGAA
ncbi:MAG: hypothetical protein H0U03_07500 [Actinobacteria bacterium]|nr:hypothetical protein [Actinomycetota bacterium]